VAEEFPTRETQPENSFLTRTWHLKLPEFQALASVNIINGKKLKAHEFDRA